MHESLKNLIKEERERRKEAHRFAKAAVPLMDALRGELLSIVNEYEKELGVDGKIAVTTLHSGLGLEIKRLPQGPRCELYADRVHRVLRVTRSNGEATPVAVGYDDEGALVLATPEPQISAFAAAVIAPILFPELFELGRIR